MGHDAKATGRSHIDEYTIENLTDRRPDDGRVDISLNLTGKELGLDLLREEPPPYSLHDLHHPGKAVPRLNVVIQIVGSRGGWLALIWTVRC